MSSTIHLPPTTQRWLRDSPLTPYVMGYFDHLIQCRYAVITTEKYMAAIAHLGLWMGQSQLTIEQLDEQAVNRFLDEHLPMCDCPRPVFRIRSDLRTACAHLLHILRDCGVIPWPTTPTAPVIKKSTPNILPIFKSLPRTKTSFLKKAKKGLLNAVFVNHAHFRDNANGVNQTCHIGCPLSVASVQHH